MEHGRLRTLLDLHGARVDISDLQVETLAEYAYREVFISTHFRFDVNALQS